MVGSSGARPAVDVQEDPEEPKVEKAKRVSPARYKQRTEVFEQLMKYVNSDAKQPDKDLIRLINVDSEDVY